jgi:hypothetical protein
MEKPKAANKRKRVKIEENKKKKPTRQLLFSNKLPAAEAHN